MSGVGDSEANAPRSPSYGDADSKLKPKSVNQEPNNQTKASRCPEFCQLIGRRETRNNELSKRERDLRRRLEMLECWMPAVTMMRMMTSNVKADDIARVIDKQAARMTVSCLCPNSTLSQHRDIRIREVEGKRKKAQMRLDQAKKLLDEKQSAVDEQSERIEGERKKREILEEKIKQLESKISISNNLNKAPSAESVASIGPDELMYLTKLEELVKSEETSKRHLEELEKRQEMYMKALEAAGQVWNEEEQNQKVDGLKSQLEVKSSANQELAERICQLEDQVETLKSKLITCNEKLKNYTGKTSVEAMIGTDQTYRDIELSAIPEFREVSVIYDDSDFTVDEGVDATVATESRATSATIEVTERAVQDLIIDYDDAETITEPEQQFVNLQEPVSKGEQQFVSLQEPVSKGEQQFISLQESVWKGDEPTSALIYDSSVAELETRSKTSKFDGQTPTDGNCVFIEIPELEMWATNIDKIRTIVEKCDTCKIVKPDVVMIQKAISRRLRKEFTEDHDENSPMHPDKIPLAEPRGEIEDRVSKINEKEPEINKLLGKKKSSELFLASGIDGMSGAAPSTPPASLGGPVAMSTPMAQLMKRISSDNINKNKNDKLSRIGMIPEESEHSSSHLSTIGSDHSASMSVNDVSDRIEMNKSGNMIEHVEVPVRSATRMELQSRESIVTKSPSKSPKSPKSGPSQEINDGEEQIIRETISDEIVINNNDRRQVNAGEEQEIGEIGEIREIGEQREIVAAGMIDEAKGDVASSRVGTNVEIREIGDGEIQVEEKVEENKRNESQVQDMQRVDEIGGNENKDDGGAGFTGEIAVSKSTSGTDIIQRGSSNIQGPVHGSGGEGSCRGGMTSAVHSLEKVDSPIKCPVTSRLSSCICHALRRWPRMTRKEYQQSREAITKTPTPTQRPRKITGSKTVSSATVASIEIQTNAERQEDSSDGNMCDPCECEPCTSVSSTSSELDPSEARKSIVETREQGVMAKIYRTRR